MKTAISIPDPLFNAVERLARRLGVSRSEVFQRAVKEFLANHKDKGVTEALNEVYGCDRVEARLDSLLEHMQVASIREEEW